VRRPLLAMLAVALLAGQAPATEIFEKVGTVGFQFLEIGAGTRGTGMGEAMVAATEGIESLYWNPAGLRFLGGPTLYFSYGTWPADISHQYAAFATRPGFIPGIVGVSVTALTMDPMPVLTATNPGGVGVEFQPYDLAVGLTYTRVFTDKFAAGGSVKWVHSGLGDLSILGEGGRLKDFCVDTVVGDFGTLYDTGFRSLRIGLVIQNMGAEGVFYEETVPVPVTFKFGVSMDVIDTPGQAMQASVEFKHPADTSEKINVGAEYSLNDTYFLRAGYKMGYDEEGFTAGGGARVDVPRIGRRVGVDVSYAEFGYLGQVIRVGATFEPQIVCPVPRVMPLGAYSLGGSNAIEWVDPAAVGRVSYLAECSRSSEFETTFARSGWISGTKHEFTGLTDGQIYYYRVRTKCQSGATSDWSSRQHSIQDATPPETVVSGEVASVEFDPVDGGAIVVTVDASDAGSGVESVEMYWRKDGGPPVSSEADLTDFPAAAQVALLTPADAGVYEFYTRGTDKVGNVEPESGEPGWIVEAIAETLTCEQEMDALLGQLGDLKFEYDRFEILPAGEMILQRVADGLLRAGCEDLIVLVEGHCDTFGTVAYNRGLGERRASAVREYLTSLGVDPERVRTDNPGEGVPKTVCTTVEDCAPNRRAHIRLIDE